MDIIVGDTELTPHRRTALRRCVWPRVQHILAETEFRINQAKGRLKDALRVRDAFYLWLFPDLDPDQMALPKLPPGAMDAIRPVPSSTQLIVGGDSERQMSGSLQPPGATPRPRCVF